VIGAAGPHARRAWAPTLRQLQAERRVNVVLTVELADARPNTIDNLKDLYGEQVDVILTPHFTNCKMSPQFEARLRNKLRQLQVDAVIVASDPLSHLAYLEVLIPTGVHVLVDKPIVAFEQVSNDSAQASRVLTEYGQLLDAASANADQLVAVAVQRRHHHGFQLVRELVVEAATNFGCPITFMLSSHADGQFRSPSEIESLTYHGTREGYGKLFHSGMHMVDVQSVLMQAAAAAAGMHYTAFTAFAHAVRPGGFIKQIPAPTLEAIFGQKALDHDGFLGHGELDLAANTAFETDGEITTTALLDLAHNSVSGRAWVEANGDLYKGNGRQKHEHHMIRQGPFQTIYLNTCQTKHIHDVNTDDDFACGGNNHFDITVFRNHEVWPTPTVPMERIGAADIAASHGLSSGRLLNSYAKDQTLLDFIDAVTGVCPIGNHPSRLEDHWLNSAWMSAIAESMATNWPITTKIMQPEETF
jgi:predicted dehydrogenase